MEGEPGIGKSAFVRHFLKNAQDVVVLEASADESETSLEYGVLSQLVSPNDGRAPAPTGNAFTVGAELLVTLDSLQDRAPVVLVIDDAHWMDASSAGALLFALRRLYADRVLALLATRPGGLDRLGSSWGRLLADPERADVVRLGGLSAEEVGLLASSLGYTAMPRGASERLTAHTGGHPLYVKALLAELPGGALTADSGQLPAPHSFAATVLARVSKLGPNTQELLTAVAVGGLHCPLALAGAVAGLRDPAAALEEAVSSGLLTLMPDEVPEEVTFPHPLVRAAIHDDVSPRRRRELHGAWARVTAGPVSLAHRVAASNGADDALAGELVSVAESEFAGGALPAGVDHLLEASRLAGSVALREGALLRAVEILGAAGDVPRAHSLRDAVLSCSDGPRRAFALATLTASAGRLAEAEAALVEVTERSDFSSEPNLRGLVFCSLGIVCAYAGRGEQATAWAQRALEHQADDVTVKVTAQQALAQGLALCGRSAEGIGVLHALSPSRIAPEPFEAELMATRGNLKLWDGDLRGAVEDLLAVVRWSRAGTPLRSLPNAYGSLAEAEYWLGRWDDGLTHAEVAVSLAQESDQVWELPFVHKVASFFHAGRGAFKLAAEHVSAARRAVELAALPVSVYHVAVAAANLASAQGDWSGALGALSELRESALQAVALDLAGRAWQAVAVEALLRTGQLDAAGNLLDELDAALERRADGVLAVEALRLRGGLEGARERPAKARAAFLRARKLAAASSAPLVGARLELDFGSFMRRTGSRKLAVGALRAAHEAFESLAARPWLERCQAELAACGVHAGGGGEESELELTAREQVIARLVAAGKSNREVAAELYLSTKAIEYHLANIFTKLGIRSRHQLAPLISSPGEGAATQTRAAARASL